MDLTDPIDQTIVSRTELRAGDLGMIVYLHSTIYAAGRGFDTTFEAYGAGPLSDFVKTRNPREQLWIAEGNNRIVGCVAVVSASSQTAQLRRCNPPIRAQIHVRA